MSDDIFNFQIDFEALNKDVENVCRNLDLYDEESVQAAAYAMVENVETLLSKSMRIVPHDEGMLQGSGSAKVQNQEVAHGNNNGTIIQTSEVPKVAPGSVIQGNVSFNEPYAARQHEELGYRHKEGRQAKYLESPLKEFVQTFCQNIADAVRDVRR